MEEIVKKVRQRAPDVAKEGVAGLRDSQDREVRLRISAETADKMKKRAEVTLEAPVGSTYAMICDEGLYLGGDDEAPPPLAYFSAGIAF
jgi:hypothetical protein